MEDLDLITKYQAQLDSLDFYQLYKDAIKSGNDYIDLFDLMFDIEEELNMDNLSIYHQAKKLGFTVFDDNDLCNFVMDNADIIKFDPEINGKSLLTKLANRFDSELAYIQDDLDEASLYSVLDRLNRELSEDEQYVRKINVQLYPQAAQGLQCVICLQLQRGDLIYLHLNIPEHTDWYYGFVELGGAINTSKALAYQHKIFQIVLSYCGR